MITPYKIERDIAGYNGFGLQPSNLKFSADLAATTDTTLTIPDGASLGMPGATKNRFLAIIKVEWGEEVWFAMNATAAVPAGASFAETDSELIVSTQDFAREVVAGDVLHFFSTPGAEVSVVLYTLPAN